MKSFKEYLIEDAQYDYNIRTTAVELFDKVVKYVVANSNKYIEELSKFRDMGTTDLDDAIIMSPDELGHEYSDLQILLTYIDGKNKGETYVPDNTNKNYELCLLVIDPKTKNYDSMLSLLKTRKSTFVHEFTHYMDLKRYKKKDKTPDYEHPKQKDYETEFAYKVAVLIYKEKYRKNNLEKNAFYQQFAHGVDEFLDSISDDEKDKIFSNFNTFYNNIKKYVNQGPIDVFAYDEKTCRKLINRIYKMWDFFKNK